MMRVRSSVDSWHDLARLVAKIEQCVEACARLDAYRPLGVGGYQRLVAAFDQRLRDLTDEVEAQVDRVTAERLTQDVITKQIQAEHVAWAKTRAS